jgi:hypothetical protein
MEDGGWRKRVSRLLLDLIVLLGQLYLELGTSVFGASSDRRAEFAKTRGIENGTSRIMTVLVDAGQEILDVPFCLPDDVPSGHLSRRKDALTAACLGDSKVSHRCDP